VIAAWSPMALTFGAALGYVWLWSHERDRRGWPVRRALAFLAGCTLLVVALSPVFDRYADADFGGHMAQHLLLAMLAPLLLVLAAPLTLLLRQLPHRQARGLGRLLHRRSVHVLAHPVAALVLASGGLMALYFTPLYEVSTRSDAVHGLVHVYLLASGLLFAWAIAGPDPGPGRPPVLVRLVVLGAAVAVHATVAQLLYAGLLVDVHEPAAEMQAAGSLMYFGGDTAELLLAVALLFTWRPRPVGRLTSGLTG
jgi:putative membrane protein